MSETDPLILENIQVFFISFLAAIVTNWIAYWKGFYVSPPHKKSRVQLGEVLGAFFIFLAIQMIIVPAVYIAIIMINNKSGHFISNGWLTVLSMAVTSLGLFAYSYFLLPQANTRIWNSEGFRPIRNFFFGIFTAFICYPLVIALGQVTSLLIYLTTQEQIIEQVPVVALKMSMTNPLLFLTTVVFIALIVPAMEELLFRGFLQNYLKRFFGSKGAIFTASLIFAGFHYSPLQGVSNLHFLSALFLLSLYLGYLYERQASLWAPIGLHVFFNTISVVMITLS